MGGADHAAGGLVVFRSFGVALLLFFRKIAFNSKYLLDVLEVMSESEVALETTTPSSPGVLRPVDNDNYVHVIMPMFVQW